MKHPAVSHLIGAVQTVALAALGWVLTLIGVNLLGALLFFLHPSYGNDQGLDTVLFYWSLFLSPVGALYGGIGGVVLWVIDRRSPQLKRKTYLRIGLGYLAGLIVAVLAIGLFYS
jgi:hypothetical protein